MVPIFNYAIIQAVPDTRRDERVNIGLIVFRDDRLDVRVMETRKLRALALGPWDTEIDAFTTALARIDNPDQSAEQRLSSIELIANQFIASKTGWFEARDKGEYEKTVDKIVKTLIAKPVAPKRREHSTVATEISRELRKAQILASHEETIDSGKVVRNYPVTHELEADFAQMNSQLHVAAVLDLRSTSPRLAQAALKAVVLDQAQAAHPDVKVHRIGVYAAAPARAEELHDNLAVLSAYSNDLVNWDDPQDREGLKRIFFDAFNSHHPTPLN